MKQDVVITGSGGQGILLTGTLLAQAAVEENKFVTWLPSYGAEKRGGLSFCFVIISDDEIASPVTAHPGVLLALDVIGFEAYKSDLKENGLLIVNTSLIDPAKYVMEKQFNLVEVQANHIAERIGEPRTMNMVGLGVYLAITRAVSLDSAFKTLEKGLSAKHREMLECNIKALRQGYELGRQWKEENPSGRGKK